MPTNTASLPYKISLSNTILHNHPSQNAIERILSASLEAVDPFEIIHKTIKRKGNFLQINNRSYPLIEFEHIYLIGIGKASFTMASATAQILGKYITSGIVLVKDLPEESSTITKLSPTEMILLDKISIIKAGHPIPNRQSLEGTQKIISLLSSTGSKDLIICLISGGGSALMSSPADEISLTDIQRLTKILLANGATIKEINTIRKHLDRVKGGRLAQAAYPARMVTLILSDVIDDPLDMIASGPTVPDPTTFHDVDNIIKKYQLDADLPASITRHIENGLAGNIIETPKPNNPVFENVDNFIIGNLYKAATAGFLQARKEGFNTLLLTTSLQGEAQYVGQFLATILKQIAKTGEPIPRPSCLIAGGETTVTIHGNGLGGRNLELALGAVDVLADLPNIALITLATDGDDGPTHAAGAIVTGDTKANATKQKMHTRDYLQRNDSYPFFKSLNSLIITGPTGTNVNDLFFLFAF